MPSKPAPDHFLNYAEVAELIGLAVKTIRNRKCGTNELIRIKRGGRVLFSFNDVQAWMLRQVRKAEEEQRQRERAVKSMAADKDRIRQAINNTYLTIINGGKYR